MAFSFVAAKYASWNQNPEYIQACRASRHAGESTSYTPAHPAGASPTDVTTFNAGIAGWNESNLPAIMYDLWPCETWKHFKSCPKPDHKRDRQGNLMYERYPRPGHAARPILDWPIFRGIDKISTKVPWWLLELWSRLEPRLEWADIDMLMENVGQRKSLSKQHFVNSTMNNRCSRTRQAWIMLSWREKSKLNQPNIARDSVLAKLSQAQKNANTTRGSTPGLDLHGNRVPMPGRQGRNIAVVPQRKIGAIISHRRPSTRTTRAAPTPETDDELSSVVERDPDDSNDISDSNQKTSKDSTTSEFEPEPQLSRIRRYASTPPIESTSEAESPPAGHRGGKMKRLPYPVHPGMPEKRRRIDEDKDQDEVMEDSLSRQAIQQRRPKFVQEVQSHRERRQGPRSTTWSIKNQVLFPYPTSENSRGDSLRLKDTRCSSNPPGQRLMDSLAAARNDSLSANVRTNSHSHDQPNLQHKGTTYKIIGQASRLNYHGLLNEGKQPSNSTQDCPRPRNLPRPFRGRAHEDIRTSNSQNYLYRWPSSQNVLSDRPGHYINSLENGSLMLGDLGNIFFNHSAPNNWPTERPLIPRVPDVVDINGMPLPKPILLPSAAQELSSSSSLPVDPSTFFASGAQENAYPDPSVRDSGNWEPNRPHEEFMAFNEKATECWSSTTTRTASRSFSIAEDMASASQELAQQELAPKLTVRGSESIAWDSNPLLWGTEWVSFINDHDAAPLLGVLKWDEI